MPSVLEQMKTKMEADASLMQILTGGIHLRPFERNKTTAVFGVDQAHYNPAAYLVDGDEIPHFQELSIPTSYNGLPEVRMIAAAHATGKKALRDASQKLYVMFHDWPCPTDYGPPSFFRWAYTTSILDSEEFIGAVTSTVTFQRTGVRAVLT